MTRRSKGEGFVSKTPKYGRYSGSLTHEGKRRTVYGHTRAEVVAKLDDLKRRRDEGRWEIEGAETVSELLDAWMRSKEGHVAYNTLRTYQPMVQHLKDHLGTRRLERLKPTHVQDAYAAMVQAGLRPATVRYCASVLRMALKMAVEWHLLTWNPALVIAMPEHTKRRVQVLESGELLQLFVDTQDTEWHALWVVLGTTGMRLSEALGLQWSGIDWDEGRYDLTEQLEYRRRDGFYLVPLKSKEADEGRTITFTSRALDALRTHRQQQREMQTRASEWHESDFVFTRRDGQPLHQQAANKAFHRALLHQSLVGYTPHCLRHTAITLWLLGGVSLSEVSEWAGHADSAITLRIYAHVTRQAQLGMGQRMDAILTAAEAERTASIPQIVHTADEGGAENGELQQKTGTDEN